MPRRRRRRPPNNFSTPTPAALDSAPNPTAFPIAGASFNANGPRRARNPAIYPLANLHNVANCLIALFALDFAFR